jgi:hypothetical protein
VSALTGGQPARDADVVQAAVIASAPLDSLARRRRLTGEHVRATGIEESTFHFPG